MRTTVFAAALGLILSAASSRSLLAFSEETIQVNVPFAFHVLDRTLPRGDYVIKSAGIVDPALLEIRKADGSEAMLFLVIKKAPGPPPSAPPPPGRSRRPGPRGARPPARLPAPPA